MTVSYELNCGQPVLHKDGIPVAKPLDKLSFAYADWGDGPVILKHGDPDFVNKWVLQNKSQPGLSDSIQTLEFSSFPPGAIPIDLINEALRGSAKARNSLFPSQQVIDVDAKVLSVEDRLVQRGYSIDELDRDNPYTQFESDSGG